MGLFHVVDDTFVITLNKGMYRQVKLYTRDGKLYAAHGQGFILLMGSRSTSNPHVSWLEFWTANPHIRLNVDDPHRPPTLIQLTRSSA